MCHGLVKYSVLVSVSTKMQRLVLSSICQNTAIGASLETTSDRYFRFKDFFLFLFAPARNLRAHVRPPCAATRARPRLKFLRGPRERSSRRRRRDVTTSDCLDTHWRPHSQECVTQISSTFPPPRGAFSHTESLGVSLKERGRAAVDFTSFSPCGTKCIRAQIIVNFIRVWKTQFFVDSGDHDLRIAIKSPECVLVSQSPLNRTLPSARAQFCAGRSWMFQQDHELCHTSRASARTEFCDLYLLMINKK